jgi:hypothetical protein
MFNLFKFVSHNYDCHSSFQKNKKDVLNFDPEFTKEEPILTPVNPELIRTINQDEFRGFSFYNSDYGKLAPHKGKH